MTKVKICGFTNAENARQAALAGVDAVGLVFYDKSPRHVNIDVAREIVAALPPFVNRVGLFVNANPSLIDEVLCDETVNECMQYDMPFIKSVGVSSETDLKKFANDFSKASALLLDSYSSNTYGGTGKPFDWSLACVEIDLPVILAGGLNPNNVAEAISQVKPYAVDASSGVESAKGVKDIDKIKSFIINIRS